MKDHKNQVIDLLQAIKNELVKKYNTEGALVAVSPEYLHLLAQNVRKCIIIIDEKLENKEIPIMEVDPVPDSMENLEENLKTLADNPKLMKAYIRELAGPPPIKTEELDSDIPKDYNRYNAYISSLWKQLHDTTWSNNQIGEHSLPYKFEAPCRTWMVEVHHKKPHCGSDYYVELLGKIAKDGRYNYLKSCGSKTAGGALTLVLEWIREIERR